MHRGKANRQKEKQTICPKVCGQATVRVKALINHKQNAVLRVIGVSVIFFSYINKQLISLSVWAPAS